MTGYSQPHPDVTGWFALIAASTHEIERRRFLLDYPAETAPAELPPFPAYYVHDLTQLYIKDSRDMAGAIDRARNKT